MYPETSLVATGVILPLVGVVAVCFRFFVRMRPKHVALGIDDWAILVACILVCGMGALQITGAVVGEFGRDGQVIVPKRSHITDKIVYALVVIEKPAFGCIKLSVLFFYRRIFTYKRFRIINNIIIVLVVLWTLAFWLAEIFLCGTHPKALWDGKPANVHCANQSYLLLWFAITDVLGDIVILTMPYPCIRKLQMDRRRKIAISGVFMLGTLAVIAGIVRMGFVVKGFTVQSVQYNATGKAINGVSSPPTFWTIAEVSIAILAACLPILAPIIRKAPRPSKIATYFKNTTSFQSSRKQSTKLEHTSSSQEGINPGFGTHENNWAAPAIPDRLFQGRLEPWNGLEMHRINHDDEGDQKDLGG